MDRENPGQTSESPASTVSPFELDDWDSIVRQFPQSSFFHGKAWARVLCDTYGFSPTYLVLGATKAPQAILPLMEVASWMTGRRAIGLPFTDECSPLFHDAKSANNLFDVGRTIGNKRGWKYLEIRGGVHCLPGSKPSTTFYGHSIHLGADNPTLLANVEPSTRRAIRKAEQSGLKTLISTDRAELEDFFQLFCITRKRHGLPVQPYTFFKNIHKSIIAQGSGVVVIVKKGNIPIAGAIYFHFGSTSLYKYGASDERFQEFRGNNLAMWEAIKWHNNRGFILLDFGRTSISNSGLRRFKLGWGAIERQINYVRYDLGINDFSCVQDEATGWYNALFSRLPIPLARLAGSLLYKHAA